MASNMASNVAALLTVPTDPSAQQTRSLQCGVLAGAAKGACGGRTVCVHRLCWGRTAAGRGDSAAEGSAVHWHSDRHGQESQGLREVRALAVACELAVGARGWRKSPDELRACTRTLGADRSTGANQALVLVLVALALVVVLVWSGVPGTRAS